MACKLLIVLCNACFVSANTEETIHLRHPYNLAGDEPYAKRTDYIVNVLQLATQKSNRKFQLNVVPIKTITASRNIRNVEQKHYDITWIHTDKEREKRLYPVRIPLFKGLIGWRLMFVHSSNAQMFENTHELSQLQEYIAGLGHDWPDLQVFQNNKLKTMTATSRNSLLLMLDGHRIDYFPRGAVEIWDEYKQIGNSSIEVDPHIALVYPTAYYFFLRNEDKHIAEIIKQGLNNAIKDGSFDNLLFKHYGEDINKSKLATRRVFRISNPNFPVGEETENPDLWYNTAIQTRVNSE